MNSNLVYGFLDESPSLNDKTFFFCVDILSTSDRINKKLRNILKKTRKRIIKKKLKSVPELKFHTSDEKTRVFVLSQIAQHDVKIVVLVVDKEGRRVEDNPSNYGMVIGTTLVNTFLLYLTGQTK